MNLISVIVPVYNVEKYIRRCVDSILQQTHENLEIILVDDGSVDSSGVICDEFDRSDRRVKVVHKENGGLSSARNAGLDVSTGDYIGFVDGDDYIKPDMYKKLLIGLQDYSGDYSTGGMIEKSMSGGETVRGCKDEGIIIQNKREAFVDYLTDMRYNLSSVCCKLFKRELIDTARFTEGIIGEDIDFMYRLIERVNRVVCINTPVYYYFHREKSITTSFITERSFDMIRTSDRMDKFFMERHTDLMWIATVARLRYILDIRRQTKRSSDVTGDYARRLDRLVRREFGRFVLCRGIPISSRFLMLSMAGGVFDYVFPICDIILKILNNGS